jgi:L-lysine exporter family protein LysE/ArgO
MTDSIIATFVAAFVLRLTFNLVPGPVNVTALQRGAQRGVQAVLLVRLGSLAGTLIWAVAGFTGAGVAVQNPQSRVLLSVAGTAILLLLAWRALRTARSTGHRGDRAGTPRGDALAGALIALASPLEAAFWLGIGGTFVGVATAAARIAGTTSFLCGFIAADLLFMAAFATLVGWGRGVTGGRFTRAANLLCVATLAWFALNPIIGAISSIAA